MSKTKNKNKEKVKDSISMLYLEEPMRRRISRLPITGEITQVCDPEKLRSEMLAAKETGGKVFVYKRKKEIRAVCIFRREEREIPLGLAAKETDELLGLHRKKHTTDANEPEKTIQYDKKSDSEDTVEASDRRITKPRKSSSNHKQALKDFFSYTSSDRTSVEVDADTADSPEYKASLVTRSCYVQSGFYVAPSYETKREDLASLFRREISEFLIDSSKTPAYIWEDEIVMTNQLKSGGKYISIGIFGYPLGMVIGLLIGISMGADNLGLALLWSVVFGGIFSTAATTIVRTVRDHTPSGD